MIARSPEPGAHDENARLINIITYITIYIDEKGKLATMNPAFSNFSGLKCVFEKLRFRDGLVLTVGQTHRNRDAFSNLLRHIVLP